MRFEKLAENAVKLPQNLYRNRFNFLAASIGIAAALPSQAFASENPFTPNSEGNINILVACITRGDSLTLNFGQTEDSIDVDGITYSIPGGNYSVIVGDQETNVSYIAAFGSKNREGSLSFLAGPNLPDATNPYSAEIRNEYNPVFKKDLVTGIIRNGEWNDVQVSLQRLCYTPQS